VLMHGSLVHMSYENKSDQSRQAYTLHIIEGPPHATYPADNWYRPPTPIHTPPALSLASAFAPTTHGPPLLGQRSRLQAAATLVQPGEGLLTTANGHGAASSNHSTTS
jgi:ectoine hydroxylase-related dioxygenase (phytanoyl-CoA dioxygenase family)